jgi:hypothetical protein
MKIERTTNGKPMTTPQALHLDMDQTHAGNISIKLHDFGKKVGLQLRMIPCLGSNQSIALSDIQRANVKMMATKQQYLTNAYTVKLENTHIMNLDAEVKNTRHCKNLS